MKTSIQLFLTLTLIQLSLTCGVRATISSHTEAEIEAILTELDPDRDGNIPEELWYTKANAVNKNVFFEILTTISGQQMPLCKIGLQAGDGRLFHIGNDGAVYT